MEQYERFLPYFADRYEFRFCRIDEAEHLVEFIDKHWKNNHALVRSKALLDWQYRDDTQQRYNFAVAVHKGTGEFHAIEGFIPTTQYDQSIHGPMLWGALWKAREDVNEPGLGIMVDLFSLRNIPHSLAMGVGLSKQAVANHKSQHYQVGNLEQFFMLNPAITCYGLCVPNGAHSPILEKNTTDSLIPLKKTDYAALEASCFHKMVPYKSKQYYINRYYRHPIYQYQCYGIERSEDIIAMLFTRICEYQGNRCIRIVDYIGDGTELAGNGTLFQQLLKQQNAEYIDFMEYGFPKDALLSGGFLDRHATDAIIPNYYEPFVQQNCEVVFNFPPENPQALQYVVKGDADQDRPNIVD